MPGNANWVGAMLDRLRALGRGLRPRPRPTPRHPSDYPMLGPARPLYANSVEHGDQHGPRPPARPSGPPPRQPRGRA